MKKLWFLIALFAFTSVKAQESTQSDSVVIQAFEVSNLTKAAEETDEALRRIRSAFEKNVNAHQILKEYNVALEKNTELRNDTIRKSLEGYNLWALTDIYSNWSSYEKEIESIKGDFSTLSEDYQEVLVTGSDYHKRWKLTQTQKKEDIPEPLLVRIDDIVNNLELANESLKDSLNIILTYFDVVTREHTQILNIKTEIQNISNDKRLNIFAKDSPPLSVAFKTVESDDNIAEQFSGTVTSSFGRTKNYLSDNRNFAELHLIIFILLTGVFFYFQYLFKKSELNNHRLQPVAVYLINKPFFVGLIFSMFIGFWIYEDPPAYVANTLVLSVVLSIIGILPGIVTKRVRYVYLFMALLFLLNYFESFMTSYPLTQRVMVLLQSFLVFFGLAYSLRPKSAIKQSEMKSWRKISNRVFPFYLLLSVLAIYGNFTGSLFLARVLTKTMVYTITAGVILMIIYSVLGSLLELLLQSNARKYVHLIAQKGDIIKRKLMMYLRWFFYYLWVRSFLSQIGLITYILESYDALMDTGQNFGNVYLSIGQVVSFIVILLVFSLIANIFKDLLSIELLPRLNLKKGVPMAAGSITRYIILVLGFLMAVAAAGISLDKLGFIAGALGVGIGFGLQNVVGNFVSGLILIFERPIRVDDVISSGTVEGTITEVGIRASKIRDWDGAEVIVPNMDLVSQQVTNWTLSDSKRRRELLIRVEYGSNPNKVIEAINSVVLGHDGVITEPAPLVLFLGFKEYSLDFRVLFWCTENMLSTTSAVALNIYNKLEAEGIKIPIPKREIVETKPEPKKMIKKTATTKPKAKKAKTNTEENKSDSEVPKKD